MMCPSLWHLAILIVFVCCRCCLWQFTATVQVAFVVRLDEQQATSSAAGASITLYSVYKSKYNWNVMALVAAKLEPIAACTLLAVSANLFAFLLSPCWMPFQMWCLHLRHLTATFYYHFFHLRLPRERTCASRLDCLTPFTAAVLSGWPLQAA